jgi:long-chain acyl-CoA synthetase
VDTSVPRRITYAEYGELVESAGKGFVSAGIRPGEVIAIYLANCWEYAVVYHATTLAGAIPTLLNPSYREREVRYQLENSGAVALVTDAPQISGMNLQGLPQLRLLYTTRQSHAGALPFSDLLQRNSAKLPQMQAASDTVLAALPYSSGTTGLPKGVMLSHSNLVSNVYQYLAPGEELTPRAGESVLGFLPLYHIYGLNVVLNPTLIVGGKLVLMPRFDAEKVCTVLVEEEITYLPVVPPVMNALCTAAEQGRFPAQHSIRGAKSGAAPLAPELPRRFTELTGIRVRQGYGMTEASPVTHLGYIEPDLCRPSSIGRSVALTDCRLLREDASEAAPGEPGELVMRGPQFMLGYWNATDATREVLRDGWYYSGDVAVRDERGFYNIVDRRKELIKYKGFAIAPAEVEAVLLEHPAVQDCGVVGKKDTDAGEIPCAFIVLKADSTEKELAGFVAERLVSYKQPREVRFVQSIPRNPSGKILRKDLRAQL